MEHYLGEKLKKLRESRGWTQADLAKRLNKAVSTVSGYESDINEQEAEIVRLIFDKYVYEGYGAQRIATYLNNAGYRARSGKCWHPGSLRGMVGNLTYMGVLRCGDARSELMPELQIIPQEEFEAAQRIREDRSAHAAEEAEHHVPLRTRGQLYEELISYADLYDSASFEAKKMIVSQLIRRVEVYRGYQIHVDFNFDLAQYLENSDELAC